MTDSLVSLIERVGSEAYLGLLDGLNDSQNRLMIWLDT